MQADLRQPYGPHACHIAPIPCHHPSLLLVEEMD